MSGNPLASLALAVIANKTGTAVQVESEHLPRDLVTGTRGRRDTSCGSGPDTSGDREVDHDDER
ncbi:hypothetical protein [Umezawaea beigongshangensis]|uniref:hypothetical protein n=1 Tax=Umezawaea beigongshangensis TaxID=2780383 RepID=UPI0018F2228C|nr:hypothetical protein [Umezawaea beigongshangensis]